MDELINFNITYRSYYYITNTLYIVLFNFFIYKILSGSNATQWNIYDV